MRLVPVLDEAIPSGRHQFACLVRMPERRDADALVRLPFLVQFGRLPVPDVRFAVTVARY